MASERGHIKVCQFLVARNADTEARSMYAVSEVPVIVLHLACPSQSLPAAMAVPPSKKRSKITEPMLLRISAAPLRQNKQRTHVNTYRIVFSFLSPRMMRGVRGKERAKCISMYETSQRSLYRNEHEDMRFRLHAWPHLTRMGTPGAAVAARNFAFIAGSNESYIHYVSFSSAIQAFSPIYARAGKYAGKCNAAWRR